MIDVPDIWATPRVIDRNQLVQLAVPAGRVPAEALRDAQSGDEVSSAIASLRAGGARVLLDPRGIRIDPHPMLGMPDAVTRSLVDGIRYVPAHDGEPGLRRAQVGALHAALALWTVEPDQPATVVMPTGTGKTETLIALFVAATMGRLLVVVPSDALRAQTVAKFARYGVLQRMGIIGPAALRPVVGTIAHGFATDGSAREFAECANVIVATPSALAASSGRLDGLMESCSHLVVDEAHHVAAPTWRRIRDRFQGRPVLQFTATPFRRDGERLGGRIIYSFPLRLAQEDGHFAPIDYIGVPTLADPDRVVAEVAVARLRADLGRGLDHALMARADTVANARGLLTLYAELAPDLRPELIEARTGTRERARILDGLRESTSRIIVCVDMLGEGYDLPKLKVAALHDPHRSLGVTLQFIGRFARTSAGDSIGRATVVAPRARAGLGDANLRRLYAEDADWDQLIVDLSTRAVAAVQTADDFEAGFGRSDGVVAMRSLLPRMSTVVYRTDCPDWDIEALEARFPPERRLTRIEVNPVAHVFWFVARDATPVRWGDLETVEDVTHDLYVGYWDAGRGRLYINCSANAGTYEDIAKAVAGPSAALIQGEPVLRALAGLDRPIPTSVGVLDGRHMDRRFSMHMGANVWASFTAAERATKTQTNIFAVGFDKGERTSVGVSLKGRVWSHRVARSISDWMDWCDVVGGKLVDETIDLGAVQDGFLSARPIEAWPALVTLAVEWSVDSVRHLSEHTSFEYRGASASILDVDLDVRAFTTEPPTVGVRAPDWTAVYQVAFGDGAISYRPVREDVMLLTPRTSTPLSTFLGRYGLRFLMAKDAVIEHPGWVVQPGRDLRPYDRAALEVDDWSSTDITREAMGPRRDQTTVQAAAARKPARGRGLAGRAP